MLLVIIPAVAVIVVALALVTAKQRTAGAAARRLPQPIDATALGEHAGRRVVLAGKLTGGELTTRFGAGIDSIRAEHPDAQASRPERLALETDKGVVELVGPAQVIVGEREEHLRDAQGRASIRRAGGNARVRVAGVVVRSEQGTYREPRFALAAGVTPGWAERPLAIYAERSARSAVPLLLLVMVVGGGLGGYTYFHTNRPRVATAVTPTTSCGERLTTFLDRGDLAGVEREVDGCEDLRPRAEGLWMLGRIDAASTAFIEARRQSPNAPYTLSEVEAVVIGQPEPVMKEYVTSFRKDWYRGLQDPPQRSLGCIAGTFNGYWRTCLPDSNLELTSVPIRFANPVSAITDTFGFAHGLPQRGMGHHEWDRQYGEDCASDGCGAAHAASNLLFYALAADPEHAALELSRLDALRRKDVGVARGSEYGIDSDSLVEQSSFTVAAVAAWFLHDDTHLDSYLNRAEAHSGDTLRQHLALGRLTTATLQGDSSKWSAIDRELHGLADHEDPKALVKRLVDLKYTQPLRLYALLGARPALQAAAKPWVEGPFVPACRSCGLFAALEATASRREAARIVGAKELETKLTEISRRMGEGWMRSSSRKTLWTLEMLYLPP